MSESASGEANDSCSGSDKEFSCPDCGKEYTTSSGLRYHLKRTDCEGVECPTCGDSCFWNQRGMMSHHSRKHGVSLRPVEFECDCCGEQSTKEPHHFNENGPNYCSHECQGKHLKQSKTITCENCGKKSTHSPPSSAGRFCDNNCAKEYFRGENHPDYTGRANYYGDQWHTQRQQARERDDYACVICGKSKDELGIIPHVHHVIPVRKFDDPNDAHYLDNLVTLCPKHHKKWEGINVRPY